MNSRKNFRVDMMILIPQLQEPSAGRALSLAFANWLGSGLRAAGDHRTELKTKGLQRTTREMGNGKNSSPRRSVPHFTAA